MPWKGARRSWRSARRNSAGASNIRACASRSEDRATKPAVRERPLFADSLGRWRFRWKPPALRYGPGAETRAMTGACMLATADASDDQLATVASVR